MTSALVLGVAATAVSVAWGLASSRLWWWGGWAAAALVAWLAGGHPPLEGGALAVQTLAMAILWQRLGGDWMLERAGARTAMSVSLGAGQLLASVLAVDGPGLIWWPALALALGGLSRLLLPGRPAQVLAAFALAGDAVLALGAGLDATASVVLFTCPLFLLFLWCRSAAREG